MVKAGLKVGDIFEDDGLRYKVLSVNEDGTYISTRNFEETKAAVEKPVAKAAQKARTRK